MIAEPACSWTRCVSRISIERVEYDAEAVAEEARRAGLPGGLAHKLVLAA